MKEEGRKIMKQEMDLALKFRWTKIEKRREESRERALLARRSRSKDFFG